MLFSTLPHSVILYSALCSGFRFWSWLNDSRSFLLSENKMSKWQDPVKSSITLVIIVWAILDTLLNNNILVRIFEDKSLKIPTKTYGNVWVVCAMIVSVSGKLMIHNILSYSDYQHPLCYLLIFIYYASFFNIIL